MKTSNGFARLRRARTSPTQRARLLAAFERSGLSAAAFARQHRLHYTTFCNWRQRQVPAKPAPDFVQVELSPPLGAVELVLELGAGARVRITDARQIELAVHLLQGAQRPDPMLSFQAHLKVFVATAPVKIPRWTFEKFPGTEDRLRHP